jgi:2-amino-4-hydroxy-6-hydroxymethyldihydropteridine diphosphokinase
VSRYWLGLGGNLGDPATTIHAALDWLAARHEVEAVSRLWDTSPRDLLDQPPFRNAAARVRAGLDPPAMLDEAKRLEAALGRAPGGVRFGPRVIDCDLLLWDGGAYADARLEIPHPRLHERRFALLPLLDLDPDLTLPDGRRLADLEAALDPREQRAEPIGRIHPTL